MWNDKSTRRAEKAVLNTIVPRRDLSCPASDLQGWIGGSSVDNNDDQYSGPTSKYQHMSIHVYMNGYPNSMTPVEATCKSPLSSRFQQRWQNLSSHSVSSAAPAPSSLNRQPLLRPIHRAFQAASSLLAGSTSRQLRSLLAGPTSTFVARTSSTPVASALNPHVTSA